MRPSQIRTLLTLMLSFIVITGHSISAPLKVGLVLDRGGKDDKSFNASAFKGTTEAKEKYGIALKVVEASLDSEFEPSMRTFAQRGFSLIIGVGFAASDAIRKVSAEFPKSHFLLLDSAVTAPNVRAIRFKEQDGAYVVGALAAMASKSKVIGFIGGMDVPLIRRFEMGYRAGATSIEPKIKIITNFVGSSALAWRDPSRAKEEAIAQYKKNADIIFAAAGASGLGVFDAAEELKKFVVGCDSNQNGVKPGRVLTSMLKRLDVAVLDTVASLTMGEFKSGAFEWGFKEGAIDYALDSYNRSLVTETMEKRANQLKQEITAGKIHVPDYYLTQKK